MYYERARAVPALFQCGDSLVRIDWRNCFHHAQALHLTSFFSSKTNVELDPRDIRSHFIKKEQTSFQCQ